MGWSSVSLRPRALSLKLRQDRLLKNNAIYLAGTVMAGGLGYVFHFTTGRMLGPADYAVVASLLSALYLVSLPGLVLQTVSMRFTGLAAGRNQLGEMRGLLIRLAASSLAVSVVVAGVLVTLAPRVAHYLQVTDDRVIYVLALAAALSWILAINRGALQGLTRFVVLSINGLVDMMGRVVSAVALIALGMGALGGLLAIILGPFLAYLHSLRALHEIRSEDRTNLVSITDVGRYAVWASVGAAGVTFLFNADVLLAKHYLTPQAAGIYASGAVLGRVVYFLGVTVAAVMFPEVTALHARDEEHFHVVDRSLLLLGAVAVALAAVYLIVPGLVVLPYGAAFGPVLPYLGAFACALGFLSLSNLLVNYFLSVNSSRFAVPLVGACLLETVLIVAFHGGVGQVLAMVSVSMGLLATTLGTFYAAERLRWRKPMKEAS